MSKRMNGYILLGIFVISVPGINSSNIIEEDFEETGFRWHYFNNKKLEDPKVVEDPTYGVHGQVLQLNSCQPFIFTSVTLRNGGKSLVSFDTLGKPMQGFSDGYTIAWMVRDPKYAGSFSPSPPYDIWQRIQYPLSYQNSFSQILFTSSPAEFEGDCSLTYVDNVRIQEKSETSSNLKNTGATSASMQLNWYVIIASVFVLLMVGTGSYLKMKSKPSPIFSRIRANPDRSFIDFDKLFEARKWTDGVKPLRFVEIQRTEQLGEGNSSEVWAYRYHGSIVAGKRLKAQTHNEGKVGGTYMANLIDQDTPEVAINKMEWEVFVIETVGKHDNIIPLTGYVADPQIVVLFHMRSKSVYDYMAVNPVCLEDKLRIAKSVAAGLTHLHYERLIHRDIALRNVLLGRTVNGRIDEVVISDFEISKFLRPGESSSECDSNYGPVALMAPEAFQKTYSIFTDVYMFSMFLYSLFTHLIPWKVYVENENYLALMTRVRQGHRPKLSWDEDTYPTFTNIIKTCWNPTPRLRTNMTEILDRLNLIRPNELPPPPFERFLGGANSYTRCDV